MAASGCAYWYVIEVVDTANFERHLIVLLYKRKIASYVCNFREIYYFALI